jgi:uncharacterized membrane protein HdeD (DUF308 family)
MRITTITHPDGSVTTVRSRTTCGCGALFTLLLAVFVIAAPAYYAGQGNWPLGWSGAVLAYVVGAVLLVGGVIAAVNRVRARSGNP